ncbi:MAG: hypothetical protein DRN49_05740 [Thaumarchaeota archaeon]|nr:MAG: hypothetical protein DRN49_05740 [Nitrososphaerota archaeon]
MRILVKLIGSGSEEDPYRIPLPDYTIIEVDYSRKIALVEVPDWYFEEVDPKTGEIIKKSKIVKKKLLRLYRRWLKRRQNIKKIWDTLTDVME